MDDHKQSQAICSPILLDCDGKALEAKADWVHFFHAHLDYLHLLSLGLSINSAELAFVKLVEKGTDLSCGIHR
jgi:hypothetical protein